MAHRPHEEPGAAPETPDPEIAGDPGGPGVKFPESDEPGQGFEEPPGDEPDA